MLRKAIAAKTPMGIRAKEQVDKGKLVGDDIVIGIIKENLFKPACSKGFVLDGFPRNIEQARALNELLEEQNVKLDSVLEMTIEEDKLMDRVCGRRIHPKSGRTYHSVFNPPREPGKDDVTGEPLIQRKDDNPGVFMKRLDAYRKETKPLIEFYRSLVIDVKQIDSDQPISHVWADMNEVLRCDEWLS